MSGWESCREKMVHPAISGLIAKLEHVLQHQVLSLVSSCTHVVMCAQYAVTLRHSLSPALQASVQLGRCKAAA